MLIRYHHLLQVPIVMAFGEGSHRQMQCCIVSAKQRKEHHSLSPHGFSCLTPAMQFFIRMLVSIKWKAGNSSLASLAENCDCVWPGFCNDSHIGLSGQSWAIDSDCLLNHFLGVWARNSSILLTMGLSFNAAMLAVQWSSLQIKQRFFKPNAASMA